MLSWLKQTTGFESAADVVAASRKQIAELEEQYNDEVGMYSQFRSRAIEYRQANNTDAARKALAMAKDCQKNMQQIEGKMATLRTQMRSLESIDGNQRMLKTMERSNNVSRKLGGTMDIRKVEDVMDTAEQFKLEHSEITEALAGKNYLDPVDEDALDAELDALVLGEGGGSVAALPEMKPREPIRTAKEMDLERQREAAFLEELDRLPPAPTRTEKLPEARPVTANIQPYVYKRE